MGIVGSIIAFAAACVASLKFWVGVMVGAFIPAVKATIAEGWAWLRQKI